MRSQAEQAAQPWRGPIPQEVMQFWGYKFETLATLPAPWGETSREYIEGREHEVVNNKAQYCSVVRTGLGKTVLCLGGEVDAGKLIYIPISHFHIEILSTILTPNKKTYSPLLQDHRIHRS